MLRVDVGYLLGSARIGLRDDVLPTIQDANAKRQLKAIMHLLGRLERCWDLPHALVTADNEDIRQTLEGLQQHPSEAIRNSDFQPVASTSELGINDPGLRGALALNRALNESLERELRSITNAPATSEARAVDRANLHALFERMTLRDSALVGDTELTDGRAHEIGRSE